MHLEGVSLAVNKIIITSGNRFLDDMYLPWDVLEKYINYLFDDVFIISHIL